MDTNTLKDRLSQLGINVPAEQMAAMQRLVGEAEEQGRRQVGKQTDEQGWLHTLDPAFDVPNGRFLFYRFHFDRRWCFTVTEHEGPERQKSLEVAVGGCNDYPATREMLMATARALVLG